MPERGLYQRALAGAGFEALTPTPAVQSRFMEALYAFKTGDLGQGPRDAMLECALWLIEAGAEVILAACTEVPLLLFAEDLPVPLLDAGQILATRAVAYARGEPLPVRSPSAPSYLKA